MMQFFRNTIKVLYGRALAVRALACAVGLFLATTAWDSPVFGAVVEAVAPLATSYGGAVASAPPAPACAVNAGRSTKLLTGVYGFAAAAKTNGGAGSRKTYVVDKTIDDASVAGTLRWAVAQAAQNGGGWITFADLKQNWISLKNFIALPSNITIDGGCQGVKIQTLVTTSQCRKDMVAGVSRVVCAPPECTSCSPAIFVINGTSNIVITNLHMKPDPSALFPWETTTGSVAESGDCISVNRDDAHPGTDRIWIAYNTFEQCHDGLVDITDNSTSDPRALPPFRLTVAFNHFVTHDKDMGVNGGLCPPPGYVGVPPWCTLFPGGSPAPQTQSEAHGVLLTLQGNLFDATAARHPRVEGLVYLHMVDNIVAYQKFPFNMTTDGKWLGTTIMAQSAGTEVLGGGRVYGRNNFYFALDAATYLTAPITVAHAPDGLFRGIIDNGAANTDSPHAHLLPAGAPIGDYKVNADWVGPPVSYSAGSSKLNFGATQADALNAVACLAAHTGAGSSFAPMGQPAGCRLAGPDSH
jgi:hypothetical protein